MSMIASAAVFSSSKIHSRHHERLAVVYVRQSTMQQMVRHQESTRLQYGLVERAMVLGWTREQVLVIDDDLGKSADSAQGRPGFQRLVAEVSLAHVGLVLGLDMSRLARSNRDWHHLLWDYQRSRGTRTSDHYELVGALAADKGNISRSLRTLEARELIVIGRSSGGKARSLWLTAEGQIWAANVTGSCD